jgi:hypothetical protein
MKNDGYENCIIHSIGKSVKFKLEPIYFGSIMLFINNVIFLANKIDIRIVGEFRISIRKYIMYQYVRDTSGQQGAGEENILILN